MMIDLRSDTLTIPDAGMREAMAMARVGDDVYSEDPTVLELQDRVAAMFGKEAALFVPSGTQGNQICIALHASTGEEVIAERNAHIFHYENAATSVIARAQIHAIGSENGAMVLEDVQEAIRPSAYYYPRTALIAVENTHNRHGGTVLPLSYLRNLRKLADHAELPIHCDGARIWNAIVSSGVDAADYGELFDTMSVCLSKGLGAPIGSLILGSREIIERARRWRKMLGGGMRQVGILAAAGLYALDVNLPKLAEDHRRARRFAEALASTDGIEIDVARVQTNVVAFRVPAFNDGEFMSGCSDLGLRIAPIKPGTMRAVFYHQVSDDDCGASIDIVQDVVRSR
ncbi:MAG: aminotransferase class I/II-fold pyridoxal phosphate-dependent enzyme [Candidatus Kapabacteria bacterium]|nr:aminotransferase class I/II-fold pyridoxal phosphate-dependent enzyme [Candidatus Kapabacteria bacterium]